ncbi:MBL fold metallo-hydrolase [Corynebacterium poyangense]|uniref:MBL fold metallo-hydrolase n=1 Tax=Corynebacterium poyangense TaxID=2684405 RepID=A0A7H0SNM5_9CORY|nr:MBL fold metallo-hydrolase [Corynebacterium poyangense]MBZ8177184.1 MBL fold metallo-hydrolase [Corynebacterium poyangense]QNQ90150.1 MBL fold metallo-hydrolase [Corynebacterium poyangense]
MSNALTMKHISVSSMDNNCYLLCSGNEGLLIDAADDAPAIFAMAEEAGVTITGVVTTHRHHDHVRALSEVLDATGAQHWASFLDAPALPVAPDVELHHGDHVEWNGFSFPVAILRGHTPGGLAVITEIDGVHHIFIGDSLFPGGLGKTSSESDFVRLYKDVTERIFDIFDDRTVIHPGHGASTTLGEERPHLSVWWDRRW